MNEKDFRETMVALEETRKRATASKATAIAYLHSIGMIDTQGNLKPEYGGK